ncbi:unnamed protein product [Phaedon cochleariae]|uniref:Uncharacterized protein n=1 Tax=Phaedon cochleariae TaxID=80249 RepID=A0A9N9SL11_PHACE|nr:unnamed protein product [Phaedon cochleariae]
MFGFDAMSLVNTIRAMRAMRCGRCGACDAVRAMRCGRCGACDAVLLDSPEWMHCACVVGDFKNSQRKLCLKSKHVCVCTQNTSKRGLDFGLGRGFSGSQAAKHLMGLAAANFAGGPGRRRRSDGDA